MRGHTLPLLFLLAALVAGPADAAAQEPAAPPEGRPTAVREPVPLALQTALASGERRLQYGDLESAREIFSKAAAEFPDRGIPHFYMARLLATEEPPDLAGAEAAARRAFRLSQERPAALIWLAGALRDAGRPAEAEAIAQEGLALFPDHSRLLNVLGTIRIAQGDVSAGLRLLQKADNVSPGNLQIRRDLALAYAKAELHGQAMKLLIELRESLPADPEAHQALADLYARVGDQERARREEEIARFLTMRADRAAARARAQRDLSVSIAAMEESLLASDPPAGNYAALWRLYSRRGDTSWNVNRMETLAAAHPRRLDARAALGMVRLLQNRIGEATEILEAVLEESPAEPLALEALRRLHEGLGRTDALVQLADRTVKSAPEAAAAHRLQAMVVAARGDDDAAIASYRRALELDDEDIESLLGLADLLRERETMEEASSLVERARKIEPDTPRTELALGLTAMARGDDEAARAHLLRAEELGGRSAVLFRSLGDLAAKRGDHLEQDYYYRLSLRSDPDQPELRKATATAG